LLVSHLAESQLVSPEDWSGAHDLVHSIGADIRPDRHGGGSEGGPVDTSEAPVYTSSSAVRLRKAKLLKVCVYPES
jgi:hypothetical protein